MPYEIPLDVYEEIKQRVASGQYASEDEVLRAAICALQSRDEEIVSIQAGIDDMEAGRTRPFEEVDAEIRRHLAQKSLSYKDL